MAGGEHPPERIWTPGECQVGAASFPEGAFPTDLCSSLHLGVPGPTCLLPATGARGAVVEGQPGLLPAWLP